MSRATRNVGEGCAEVKRAGLRVYVVGVGTPAGDVIPMSDLTGVAFEVKKDENGKPNTNVVVRSRDEAKLRAAMTDVEAMLANLKVAKI